MERNEIKDLLKGVVVVLFVTACTKGKEIQKSETIALKKQQENIRLVLDLSERKLAVLRGVDTIRSYLVAIGTTKYPTPRGNFNIHRIDWNPDWNPPDSDWTKDKSYTPPGHPANPMGRVRIVYQMPYTLHGTKEIESLGKAASHGSVRMANEDVIELAKLIMDETGNSKPDEWYDAVLGNLKKMVSVKLNSTVPLTNQK